MPTHRLRFGALVLVALSATRLLQAQETTATRTLIGGAQHVRFVAGVDTRVTRLVGGTAVFTGGRAGVLVNSSTLVAFAARTNVNRSLNTGYILTDGREAGLAFGYGGLELGRVFQPMRAVHVSGGVLLGGGAMQFHDRRWRSGTDDELPVDGFWLAEPELQIEANMTRFLRIGVGGSYRFVHGARLTGVADRDVRGAAGALTLTFGRF